MTQTKLAVVFPGQGSQSVSMLADVANAFQEVQQTFAEASAVLGYDLWDLVKNGPAEKLDNTSFTQPALLAASYAVWRILKSRVPLCPAMLAGHSLGEYTALVCANALAFTDAIKLVTARGDYMQEAVATETGAMAAIIGLEEAVVIELCLEIAHTSDQVLSPANFNSLGQIVIAGHKAAVEKAIVVAKAKGAKMAVLIPVSVPSHCILMRSAAEKLAKKLTVTSIEAPSIPVMNNVDAAYYHTPDDIRDGLVRQLYLPVRWVDIIQSFVKEGVTQLIECGPGKVLTGLNKRIDKRLQLMTTSDAASIDALLTSESNRSA